MPLGPTQNYDDETLGRWKPHPTLAVVVRVLIAALPPALSLSFGLATAHWLPPERLGLNRWVWLVGEIGCAWVLLWVTRRLARQLLPLSTLLSLGLFFPDQVPSRFRMALRAHSTKALQDRIEQLHAQGAELKGEELYATTLLGLIGELRSHDRLTRGHSERVQAYASMIGKELRLSEEDTAKLRWAALLHDVGKLHVPGAILNKTSRPSESEWAVLATHPAKGVHLAQPLQEWLGPWLDAIGQHHEKWNGTGYPAGLSGNAITYGARIVAVADTFDVITSARSYKKPMTAAAARAELARCAGTQFDPMVVRAFLAIGIGRLRLTAGPLSALASFPGIPSAPLTNLANLGSAAGGVVAVTVATVVVGLSPAAPLATPQAHEYLALAAGSALGNQPTGTHHARPSGHSGTAAPRSTSPTSVPASLSAAQGPPSTSSDATAPVTSSSTQSSSAAPTTTGAPTTDRTTAPTTKAPTSTAARRTSTATTTAARPTAPSSTTTPAKTACAKAQSGATFMPYANLNGCDLRGKHLTGLYAGAKLAGADLTGATLSALNLAGANLNNAKLGKAVISSTSFDYAKLSGADLRGAVITRSSFVGAALGSAKLSGAHLSHTSFSGSSFSGADLTGLAAGGSTNTFSGTSFSGATMSGANLEGADLTRADLRSVSAGSAVLTAAQLSRAVLRGADLRGASLARANLSSTDLGAADVRGATFAGATGRPSSVSGTKWSSTTCPNGTVSSTSCY